MKHGCWKLIGLFMLMAAPCFASGLLMPKDESIPPLAIESQRVDIQIKDGTATARIEQVFRNSVNRNLEAVYIFPLPENASISDFALYINGKRTSGELVEKDQARRTYEDIVRRMKDPGLLEHLGGNLFRVSVFPVPANGLQKIELEYTQTLAYDNGVYKFIYPLKTGERASRTLADFTVAVRLSSKLPIKSVYSPSHAIGLSRRGENAAVVGLEEDRALLDRDFVLYYTVSQKKFGLNLLTHAAAGRDRFFMMLLAPSVTMPDATMSKDVTFVFDTSGSMIGSKIEQTRKALEYCVQQLHDGDRFNIIGFSTDVTPFREKLVVADARTRREALDFIRALEARGGTAMHEAISAALAMNYDRRRPALILFLTDGRPTVGETDLDAILESARKGNRSGARLFTFGVGEDVNAHLLDKLAGQHRGLSQYVAPKEDIEVKVSSLMDKMSNPVLTHVRVVVDKLKLSKMHPGALPDLFSGDQITLFGRYAGSGDSVIRLLGEVNGQEREFVYEGTFPADNAENPFIPRLWATRRVGFLLDEIRLRGENPELKDEVIRLSREYGVMTPYTSFLVLESNEAYAQHGIERRQEKEETGDFGFLRATEHADRMPLLSERPKPELQGTPASPHGAWAGAPKSAPVAPVFDMAGEDLAAASAPEARVARAGGGAEPARLKGLYAPREAPVLRKDSGSEAIALSQVISDYKKRDNAAREIATVKQVRQKVFTWVEGRWIDNAFKKDMKRTTVPFGSDAYFQLLRDKPGLKEYLALGTKVTVVLEDGTALVVE